MTWKFEKLGAIANFKNGLNYASENFGKGMKVIGVSDFQDYYYPKYDTLDEINPNGIVRDQDLLQNGDFLFVRSNGNRELIGRCLYIKNLEADISHSGFTIRARLNRQGIENRFFLYYFKSDILKKTLRLYGGGTNINNLNQGILSNLDIPLPPLPIQRKIAAVLSAYDDLIENNNRRIALLEKMAEELYREWFVRLRFPSHENARIVKGVPEGWEVKRIGEVVDRHRFGKIYRESELQPEGDIIVIDQSVNEFLGFYNGAPEHTASINQPIMLFGDHSCKMQLMIKPFSLAENVIPFTAKGGMATTFLFYLIHNSIETTEYKRHWTELISKTVYVPSSGLQSEFSNIAAMNMAKIEKLKNIRHVLSTTRDRLLSRLMSGKIDVENLDIQFPPSMQETAHAETLRTPRGGRI
jgi:type I restriction enzyme S subunit